MHASPSPFQGESRLVDAFHGLRSALLGHPWLLSDAPSGRTSCALVLHTSSSTLGTQISVDAAKVVGTVVAYFAASATDYDKGERTDLSQDDDPQRQAGTYSQRSVLDGQDRNPPHTRRIGSVHIKPTVGGGPSQARVADKDGRTFDRENKLRPGLPTEPSNIRAEERREQCRHDRKDRKHRE